MTIVDTDPAPTVSFASASSSGEEKSGPARLEVKLSAASGKPVTVEYGVTGGTAVPGKDYALPGGVLSFEPGETSKTLVVDIKDHGIYDDDKTLELSPEEPEERGPGRERGPYPDHREHRAPARGGIPVASSRGDEKTSSVLIPRWRSPLRAGSR